MADMLLPNMSAFSKYAKGVRKQGNRVDGNAADDMQDYSARKKSSTEETGLSASSMQSILSADASIEQVEVQSQVKTSLKGRAGVLKSEIKFGMGNVESKKGKGGYEYSITGWIFCAEKRA